MLRNHLYLSTFYKQRDVNKRMSTQVLHKTII